MIIDRPELQNRRQKFVFGGVTAAFWAAWIYLWLPLLSFLAWVFGFETTYHQMVELEGFRGLLELFGIYAIVIAIMGGSLVVWALYNYLRFRGVERRQAREPVALAAMAGHFGVHPECVPCFRESHRLIVHHDGGGRIASVDVGTPEWRPACECPRDEDPRHCSPFLDPRAVQLVDRRHS